MNSVINIERLLYPFAMLSIFLLLTCGCRKSSETSQTNLEINDTNSNSDSNSNNDSNSNKTSTFEPFTTAEDWVTGPGSSLNKNTILSPYHSVIQENNSVLYYSDETPVLWSADMGWPVPSKDGKQLRMLVFGDTTILKKSNKGAGEPMNKIMCGSDATCTPFKSTDWGGVIQPDPNIEITLEDCIYSIQRKSKSAILIDFTNNFNQFLEYFGTDMNILESQAYIAQYYSPIQNIDTYNDDHVRYYCEWYMASLQAVQLYEPPLVGISQNSETSSNNIFVEAEFYPDTGISLGTQLTHSPTGKNKSIQRNTEEKENDISVYSFDYFYVCPNDSTVCSDEEKRLFFLTKSVSWVAEAIRYTNNDIVRNALGLAGAGIFDYDNNCRLDFSAADPIDIDVSCGNNGPSSCYTAMPDDTQNPNVFWGFGGKLERPTIVHDISLDIYDRNYKQECFDSDPLNDADHCVNIPRYIYIIGNGKLCETPPCATVHMGFDGYLYLVRIPASEQAVQCPAAYEYFAGIKDGFSEWLTQDEGGYEKAVPVYDLSENVGLTPNSIIYKGGKYWMAVPVARNNDNNTKTGYFAGMMVLSSHDAMNWTIEDQHDYSEGAGIQSINPMSPIFLYYSTVWLPSTLDGVEDGTMPYLFSIWKSFFGYQTGPLLSEEYNEVMQRLEPAFREYNIKMYKYVYPQ